MVAVFGAGPVGLFVVLSAFRQGAGRVIVVDGHPSRLDAARRLGAEAVDFNTEDPVTMLRELTGGAGPNRVIDAVGVDAERPKSGPAAQESEELAEESAAEVAASAPETEQQGDLWKPGDAPSQAARWYVESIAKAGTVAIIGVYPPTHSSFPIGQAMNKNLVLKMGNAEHRRYIPALLDLVAASVVDPTTVLTQEVGLATGALEAYQHFDRRQEAGSRPSSIPPPERRFFERSRNAAHKAERESAGRDPSVSAEVQTSANSASLGQMAERRTSSRRLRWPEMGVFWRNGERKEPDMRASMTFAAGFLLTAATAASYAPTVNAAAVTTCHGMTATIVGTDGRDDITGTTGADVIVTLKGWDHVDGRDGNDVICGGRGADHLQGGPVTIACTARPMGFYMARTSTATT
ncbi:MAG: zinc-binding dehydrogenase [Nocardioidaceae bacterium]